MNNTFLNIGIIQIKWYSIFIFLAMLSACLLIYKEAKKKKINEEYLINLIFYGIIFGIIGARVYYVIFNLDYYAQNVLEMFMIWRGGLAIHGGIIFTLIFLILYSRKEKVDILLTLDIIVVGLILAQSIGRWGNFFNQEAFGRVTTLKYLQNIHLPKFVINGMYIQGCYREPTFLYESIFSFLGFLIMLIIRNCKKLRVGYLTSIYLIWYGIERFFIERLRSDSLMFGPIKVAQFISLVAIIFGIFLLIKSSKNKRLYQKEKFK